MAAHGRGRTSMTGSFRPMAILVFDQKKPKPIDALPARMAAIRSQQEQSASGHSSGTQRPKQQPADADRLIGKPAHLQCDAGWIGGISDDG